MRAVPGGTVRGRRTVGAIPGRAMGAMRTIPGRAVLPGLSACRNIRRCRQTHQQRADCENCLQLHANISLECGDRRRKRSEQQRMSDAHHCMYYPQLTPTILPDFLSLLARYPRIALNTDSKCTQIGITMNATGRSVHRSV